jgi:NAD(P)-dependent dehydrogenase (short-subunit alcohol dehydrogenase family)
MNNGTKQFAGTVAVVTGVGSGIGRATARLLAQLGAKVHCADLDAQSADRVAHDIGTAVAHQLDVSDAVAVEALAARVFEEDGAVDILHNNAGIGHAGDTEHTTVDDWRRVIGVNLLGVAYGVAAFVPPMLHQGRGAHIVNTASGLGLMPAARMAAYCASKFGVVGMSEALNAELAPRGIHVTALCPGVINTAIGTTSIMRGGLAARQEQALEYYRTQGVAPEDVAAAAVFLASDASASTTGEPCPPCSHCHLCVTQWLNCERESFQGESFRLNSVPIFPCARRQSLALCLAPFENCLKLLCQVGPTCTYLYVVSIDAWPIISCTVRMSIPPATSRLAQVWRRSCTRRAGTSGSFSRAASSAFLNRFVNAL